MAEFRLSPKAQHDLDGIFDDTVAKWGLEQALRYIEALETALTKLSDAPYHGAGCEHIRQGYRRRGVERHVIYYRPTAYGIAVIRILHERMDAPRHM